MKFLNYTAITLVALLTLGCAETVAELAVDFERWRSDLSQKSVQVEDFTIPYLEGGEGAVVLLVHGFGGDKDHLTRFARHLTDSYRVISLDLPGFGESSRIPEKSYTSDEQAKRIEKFRQALDLGPVHIAGNSMGGMIATSFAKQFPEQTLSLSLFNAAGIRSPELSDLAKELKAGRNPLLISERKDMDTLMAFSFVNPPFVPDAILDVYYERGKKHRQWNDGIFKEISSEGVVVEKALPEISKPLLVVWGDQDRILHVSATQVIERLRPDATIKILENIGHAPMMELPEVSANLFKEFIRAKNIAKSDSNDEKI